jgi:hypothetical protein
MLRTRGLTLASAALILVAGCCLNNCSWAAPATEQTQTPQAETNQQSKGTNNQQQKSRTFNEMANDFVLSVEQSVAAYLQQATKYCTNESGDKEHKWLQDFLCGVKITDVVIAIFSILLVFVTIGLVVTGWVQAALLRMTAVRQLRAYVFVETANMFNVTTPLAWELIPGYVPTGAEITHTHLGPVMRMLIRNSGQTPAYAVVHWGQTYFREFPLRSRLPRHGRPPRSRGQFIVTKSSIPPNGATTKNLIMPALLTADQVADLKRGTSAIYVDGYISYRDAFRKKRRTNFRFMYGSFTGGIGITTEVTIADQGNDAN